MAGVSGVMLVTEPCAQPSDSTLAPPNSPRQLWFASKNLHNTENINTPEIPCKAVVHQQKPAKYNTLHESAPLHYTAVVRQQTLRCTKPYH